MTTAEIMFNALDAYAADSNALTFMDLDDAAHAFAAEQGISYTEVAFNTEARAVHINNKTFTRGGTN